MDYVIQISRQSPALDKNYLLLLTSNSEEKKAVNAVLRNLRTAEIGCETAGCSLGTLGGRFVLHVTGESGVSKPRSIARIANILLKTQFLPKPLITVLTGFCWGNLQNVDVDTCIIATEVLALNARQAEESSEVFRAQTLMSHVSLDESLVQELEDELKVRVGSLASLETLYKSDCSRDALVERYPEILGGEMEAFGFLESGSSWLVVKAVSDSGGNDFSRERQSEAATRAAAVLEPLLALLQRHAVVGQLQSTAEIEHLHDLLSGDTIEFDVRDLTTQTLTDYLEFCIGHRVEHKLRQYISEEDYSTSLVQYLLSAILEIVQNSVRHGKANRATISFHPTKIVIEDDGDSYDIKELKNGRGGAMAIRSLLEFSEETRAMDLHIAKSKRLEGNRYIFRMLRESRTLREARKRCSLHIQESSIGVPYGRPQVFSFDQECRTVYLDGTRVRMYSRHFDLAAALRPLVQEGRKVYVGCRSESDMHIYRQELKDLTGENLVIFIDATLPDGG